MNPERFAAWQAALQSRDQALIALAILVCSGLIAWFGWGRETAARRRLMSAAWWLVEIGLLAVGLWADLGGMIP